MRAESEDHMSTLRSTDRFGRIVTAMVTPFRPDGERVDLDQAQRLARWLTADGRNDGLVVNGLAGESASTTDEEKSALVRAVVDAVAPGVRITAGVGTDDTRHGIALAKAAERAGATGVLLLPPYGPSPSQKGILDHVLAIADSTRLPLMLFDGSDRNGLTIDQRTLMAASSHDRIVAVNDARGDLEASSWVMRQAPLSYYSACDSDHLAFLTVGATGVVSVIGHFLAERLRGMLDAHVEGDHEKALADHLTLLPVTRAMSRAKAAVTVKAVLSWAGLTLGPVRPPLAELSTYERDLILSDLKAVDALPVGVPV
jgi:4-hydroxy-tetrahydrodipicolinate synthase